MIRYTADGCWVVIGVGSVDLGCGLRCRGRPRQCTGGGGCEIVLHGTVVAAGVGVGVDAGMPGKLVRT